MNNKPEEVLRQAREQRGLTLQNMADLLAKELNQGYSQRQYQKLEEGKFPKFKREVTEGLDKILGTNLTELVYEQIVPPSKKEESPSQKDQDFYKDYIKKQDRILELEVRARDLQLHIKDLEAELKELRVVQKRFDKIEDDMLFLAARILANQDALMQQAVQFDEEQFSLLKHNADNIMLSISRLFRKEGIRVGIDS
jgi:transcriptional regulator with XRE-family HTH domain